VYFCEFKASLVYRVSSRTAKATQRNPVLKGKKKKKRNKENIKRKKFNKEGLMHILSSGKNNIEYSCLTKL